MLVAVVVVVVATPRSLNTFRHCSLQRKKRSSVITSPSPVDCLLPRVGRQNGIGDVVKWVELLVNVAFLDVCWDVLVYEVVARFAGAPGHPAFVVSPIVRRLHYLFSSINNTVEQKRKDENEKAKEEEEDHDDGDEEEEEEEEEQVVTWS